MERVHLDILGPITLKTKSSSSYILVLIDQFTKLVELAALPAQNTEFTVRAFLLHLQMASPRFLTYKLCKW